MYQRLFISACISILGVFGAIAVKATAVPAETVDIIYVDMPPYTYTDSQGRAAGMLNGLTRKVLAQQKIQGNFVEVPLSQLFERVNQGASGIVHLIGAFPVPKQQLHFSARPLAYLQLNAYYQTAPDVRNMSDLRGKEVILVKGYTYGYLRDYLLLPENRVKLILVDSHEQAFKLLHQQPHRYLLNYKKPFEQAVGEEIVQQLNRYSLSEIPVYWASTTQNSSLLLRLEQGLEALHP